MTQPDKTLLMLFDEVRGKTLGELQGLDEARARWAPPGLQNSCLWHAGHAYVVTEFLTSVALDRDPKMPPGWRQIFSWESNPAHVAPETWPPLGDVVAGLRQQHRRLRERIGSLTPEQLDGPDPVDPSHTVRRALLKAIHDEARHSGEISLLRKLMSRTFVVPPGPQG